MSFLVTIVALVLLGLACLELTQLRSRRWSADVPLAWFAGSTVFSLAVVALRFLAGLPFAPLTIALIVLLPVFAALAVGARRRTGRAAARAPGAGARWLPRPAWLFAPLAVFVVVVTAAVLVRGYDTPTQTDDGVRVRAYTALLAFDDAWGPEARNLLVQNGPLQTFVPALAWKLTGTVDPFHVNYTILADLVALLALAVGLASTRGRPERGWAGAALLLSCPLFVYHCTSTYADAVLAIYVGAGFLFVAGAAADEDPRDAARAALLFVGAAMVKQEGEIIAWSALAVLFAGIGWKYGRGALARARQPLGIALLALVPMAAKVAAVGVVAAFPLVDLLFGPARTSAAPVTDFPRVLSIVVSAIFVDGDAGILYWAVLVVALVKAADVGRLHLGWPLALVLVLFGEFAVNSLWLLPQFTIDHTTVHRALITVSVPAALWLAALAAGVVPRAEPVSAGARPAGAAGPGPKAGRRRKPR